MPDSNPGHGKGFQFVVSEPWTRRWTLIQLLKGGDGRCFVAELKPLRCPLGHSRDTCAGV